MTTDITELVKREKFEAWWEREYKHLESSKYTDAVPHIKYGFWMAYQAGGAELVEALEKAQHRLDELENDEVRQRLANAEHQLYMAELAKHNLKASRKAQFRKRRAAEKRIAELEEAEQKLCAANVTLDARAELAERHLAELESRSITVKLPESFKLAKSSSGLRYYYADEVDAALTAAGIKVEAE
ncbi:hypothetical protein ACQ0ND_002781 [Klebsiella pneumoniae]|nr:hypothetical protein [Klebsiella pneumoniae]